MAKNSKKKSEFFWANRQSPLPKTEEERAKWVAYMHEDSNRNLLPKYQH